MNINNDVLEYARKNNLSEFMTGGGCDFVGWCWPQLKNIDGWGACMIVAGTEESPDTLTEPATITVYGSDDWACGWATFQFKDAKTAIEACNDQDIRAALLWLSIEAFEDPEIVTEKIELFTKEAETLKDLFNLTMQEYSEKIAKDKGFSLVEIERAEVIEKHTENLGALPGLAKKCLLELSMINMLNVWKAENNIIFDCSVGDYLSDNLESLNPLQISFLTAFIEVWENSGI